MKKLLALFAVIGMLTMVSNVSYAQDKTEVAGTETVSTDSTPAADSTVVEEAVETVTETEVEESDVIEGLTSHQIIKQKFIEGGAGFMGIVVLALIFGLAIAIERILTLNFSTTNSKKF